MKNGLLVQEFGDLEDEAARIVSNSKGDALEKPENVSRENCMIVEKIHSVIKIPMKNTDFGAIII